MIDKQPSKRPRPTIENNHLFPTELLQRPVSELYQEQSHSTRTVTEAVELAAAQNVTHTNCQLLPVPGAHWGDVDGLQQDLCLGETDNYMLHSTLPTFPWTRDFENFIEGGSNIDVVIDHWTDEADPALALENGGRYDGGLSLVPGQAVLHHSPSWSHQPTVNEPWISVPTDFLAQSSVDDEVVHVAETQTFQRGPIAQPPYKGSDTTPQKSLITADVRHLGQNQNSTEFIPMLHRLSGGNDIISSNDIEPQIDLDWEELDMQTASSSENQLVSLEAGTAFSSSMVEVPKPHSCEKILLLNEPAVNTVERCSRDFTREGHSSQRPQRRGPLDKDSRKETSATRKLKACVRCRMQKVRVRIHRPTAFNLKFDQYSA
jgi:hypothetical protein